MKMKKSLIAILTATIIMLSTLTPLLYVQPAKAVADPSNWYMTVPGVLDSDTYALYPFNATRLTIGFSKFGEMINGPAGIGLMYGNSSIETENIDPFAADTYVPQFEWNQGWLINITYAYSGFYRNVWAFALYSDSFNDSSIGGDWKMAPSTDSTTVVGGRKYGGLAYQNGLLSPIGYATTAPLTVLYNGPRSFVALSQTTIGEDANTPLVRVSITIVFDKVKKYVLLYKDVKLLDERKFTSDLQVEFSNRGEWDLGLTQRPASYAHWFEDLSTSYDSGYHPFYKMPDNNAPLANFDVAQVISQSTPGYVGYAAYWPTPISIWMEATYLTGRTEMLSSLETTIARFTGNGTTRAFGLPDTPNNHPVAYPRGLGVWKDDPLVFVNGALLPESQSDPNGWVWDDPYVVFNTVPASGAQIWIEYKQFVHKTDMSDSPRTPYIIGEWDFDLSWTNTTASTNQFRAVTAYGITDYHDAGDGNPGEGQGLNIDREVQYQLDEVFNPFDLKSAVEKNTQRWVEYSDDPIDSTTFTTTHIPTLVVSNSTWDQYNVFSERVEDLTTGTVLNRYNGDYNLISNAGGTATFYGLDPDHYYKFLYSTYTDFTKGPFIAPTNVTAKKVNETQSHSFSPIVSMSWTDPTGVSHDLFSDEFHFSFTNMSTAPMTTNQWFNYSSDHVEWEIVPFTVFKEDTTWLESGAFNFVPASVTNGTNILGFNLTEAEFSWGITGPRGTMFTDLQDVYFKVFCADFVVNINVFYNATDMNYTVYSSVRFGPPLSEGGHGGADPYINVYEYSLPGRYEEGVVGKNADSVDSAGLSLISAAFKDKLVEYGIAAEDMYDPVIANQMPWVMSKIGSGTSLADYYYSGTDFRTALRDDWCTKWPVSSANLIGSGGPLANMLAYYGNDFATAFYGLSQFTTYSTWQNAIVPLSCWNATTKGYTDTNTTGYAVISTYQDLNGTVLFLLWGNWGRDTYYASQWFYQDGIMEFQNFPAGATSIVLQIKYKSYPEGYKPTSFNVVEVLGTISETLVEGIKGGIHPDP